ncbi:UVR8 [Symbiodinium sp. CCMP2592]|nr:UVR8 [Symbiodinium sp. CCMP2592]
MGQGCPQDGDEDADVRQHSWYGHYVHTVFAHIQSAMDLGAAGVVLLGILGEPEETMTRTEFPALLEDLQAAYALRLSPFFDHHGVEKIARKSITSARVPLGSLREQLKDKSSHGRAVIIMSAATTAFTEAESAQKAHNEHIPSGHGHVFRAFATSNDMYKTARAWQGAVEEEAAIAGSSVRCTR